MVNVRGQNSNRNVVKHTAENGHKISGDDDAARIASWSQASRIWGCGMVLNSTERNMFTTAGAEQNVSGWSWTCRIARATLHDFVVAQLRPGSHVPFFSSSVWASSSSTFDVGPLPSDSTKKIYQIWAYDFVCSFPLTLYQPAEGAHRAPPPSPPPRILPPISQERLELQT